MAQAFRLADDEGPGRGLFSMRVAAFVVAGRTRLRLSRPLELDPGAAS
jgi:hypothetical protein